MTSETIQPGEPVSAPLGAGRGVSRLWIAGAAVLAVAFVWLFYRWFEKQYLMSIDAIDDWGHAFVVPGIAGWLIWRHRGRLGFERQSIFWPALPVVLLGVMSYFFCVVQLRNHMLQGFSMLLTLFGVVAMLLGPSMLRWLFLPIVYLVFMVTISERYMLMITFKLQRVASEGAYLMLAAIGRPFGWFGVDIEGNTLELTKNSGEIIPLNVAEACSGMRMVVAFIALAGFVALVSTRSWWQRIVLLLIAAPVAILMNVVRVAVLGLVSLINPELGVGDAHTVIGTLLLFPALLLYLGVVNVLKKIVHEPEGEVKPALRVGSQGSPRAVKMGAWIAGVMILGGSAFGLQRGIDAMGIHLRKSPIHPPGNRQVSDIPFETENWVRMGTDRLESSDVVETLGTENYLNRHYVEKNPADPRHPVMIQIHVAYYTGMIDTVPHIPERCFIGGGFVQTEGARIVPLVSMDTSRWIVDRGVPSELGGDAGAIYTVRLASDPAWTDSPGRRVRLPREITPEHPISMRVSSYDTGDGGQLFAAYVFIANGGIVASAEGVRTLAFDLTSDYAYYLKVQVNSSSAGSVDEFVDQIGHLMGELIGEIMRCVPDWVEVQQGRYPLDEDGAHRQEG